KYLKSLNCPPITTGVRATDLLKRPQVTYKEMAVIDTDRSPLPKAVCEQVEISIKYEGYINRQLKQAEQFKKLEKKKLPKDLEYSTIEGLRLEARQKLDKIKPHSLGQASRISGVSPSDMAVLIIYLKSQN
ncbi:MAG: tRNA uridine-5-carboxymethylaminomethyl(34) synthesis enzyme MnmG, partial [Oscillospiraceae bacterium]